MSGPSSRHFPIDVSDICHGDVVIVDGPPASGKTTLARALGHLLRDAGRIAILFDDVPESALGDALRAFHDGRGPNDVFVVAGRFATGGGPNLHLFRTHAESGSYFFSYQPAYRTGAVGVQRHVDKAIQRATSLHLSDLSGSSPRKADALGPDARSERFQAADIPLSERREAREETPSSVARITRAVRTQDASVGETGRAMDLGSFDDAPEETPSSVARITRAVRTQDASVGETGRAMDLGSFDDAPEDGQDPPLRRAIEDEPRRAQHEARKEAAKTAERAEDSLARAVHALLVQTHALGDAVSRVGRLVVDTADAEPGKRFGRLSRG